MIEKKLVETGRQLVGVCQLFIISLMFSSLYGCAVISESRVDHLPIALDDSLETVVAAFDTSIKPTPFSSNYIKEGSQLHLRRRGIRVFFDADERAIIIRLDAPFHDGIDGIRIADRLAKLLELKGEPLREPWSFNGNLAYVFDHSSGSKVRYDVTPAGKVETIYLIR